MSSKTVVLIHGLFITKHSWAKWIERYQARGYQAYAVAYPGRDKPVATLKANHPDPKLGELDLPEVIAHIAAFIRNLDEKPIIMGHSFGGLLTQLMLQRDLGVAGVAIDSVPPQGILPTQWSFLRSVWPGINPLIPASKPYQMTFEEFQYTFVHTLPLAEQRAVYDNEVVPESRRLQRSALSANAAVDFKRKRAPLLFIAGELDHLMPAPLNRTNYERYKASPSITDFKLFPGRTHYIAGMAGWEEVADYAIDWAEKVQTRAGIPAAKAA